LEIWRIRLEPLPSSSGQSVLSAGWPRQEETAPGEAAQMRVGPAGSEPEREWVTVEVTCPECGKKSMDCRCQPCIYADNKTENP